MALPANHPARTRAVTDPSMFELTAAQADSLAEVIEQTSRSPLTFYWPQGDTISLACKSRGLDYWIHPSGEIEFEEIGSDPA